MSGNVLNGNNGKNKNAVLGSSFSNPAIRRMGEYVGYDGSGEFASYNGVAFKTLYFLILTFIGTIVYFIATPIYAKIGGDLGQVFTIKDDWTDIEITPIGGAVIAGVAIFALITAIVATFGKKTIPVTGTIYALCQGYLIAFITDCISSEYKWIPVLALILTISIVAVMLFLYVKRIVKVSQKMRAVVTISFVSILFGNLLLLVLSFIPGLNQIALAVEHVKQNPLIGLGFDIVFVVIATLFLLVDFDNIEKCVEGRMPKKAEWKASFALATTIIYLYVRLLELLIRIFAKK